MRQRWAGGYIRDGVFVIEKRIRGLKFHVSTRCTSQRSALKQLEVFESNPAGYNPVGGESADAVVMTLGLIEEFHRWHEAKVTSRWASAVRNLLIDWANAFAGKNLKTLELVRDLKDPILGQPQRAARIKSIRSFFKWLRQEKGLIQRHEDRTLDLPVPQNKPAQDSKSKFVDWRVVEAVFPVLRPEVADVLVLLCATGWHIEEARRFAKNGEVRGRNNNDLADVVGVLTVFHKNGRRHLTTIPRLEQLEAARRVRSRGYVSDNKYLSKYISRACKEAEVPRFTLGVIRHSFANWALDDGVPIESIARYLGHRSSTTTQKFYIDHARATLVLPTRTLRIVS